MPIETDVLVLGTGVAGLFFALEMADTARVTVLSKSLRGESNSRYAQGGIAAVWSADDDIAHHIEDTLVAGAGLCRPDAVQQTVQQAPERIRDLIAYGTAFTTQVDNPAEYSLHREGGHSHRRILHKDDLTGAEIVRALLAACEARPDRISFLDGWTAIDLITEQWLSRRNQTIPPEDDVVRGVYALDNATGEVDVIRAKVVVLATGGAGKVYLYTTNPKIATGDGMAMAWRAGARIANMEFVQFHPTALFHARERSFLLTEALRGEGGKLVLPAAGTTSSPPPGGKGFRFMPSYDPREELAPRDVVARAIDAEIKRRGLDCVFLDMTHMARADLEHHFPNICAKLTSLGMDIATEPIPVVPAAHFFCGGVQTDLHAESSIRNLFAIGEVACTGLHGANRLASNSLLEAIVFARAAADSIKARWASLPEVPTLPPWDTGGAVDSDELVVIRQTWEEIRRFMWNYVGIVRTHRRLKRAQGRIALLQDEISRYYWDFKVTPDLLELRNLAAVADMVVRCALRRQESRGLHFTLDFPESDPRFIRDTVIRRNP